MTADRIAELELAAETTRARLATVIDENFGMQPELFEDRRGRETTRAEHAAAAERADAKIEELTHDRESIIEEAQTRTAEHAAALGLATARVRELEGERDELLGLLNLVPQYVRDVTPAVTRLARLTDDIGAHVDRIEKATK